MNITQRLKPVLIWIIASILIHVLLLILLKFYTLDLLDIQPSKKISFKEQAILWDHPPKSIKNIQINETQPQTPPKSTENPSVELKKFDPNNIATIVAGKQGIDQQNLEGELKTTQEEIQPINSNPNFQTTPEKPILTEKSTDLQKTPVFKPLNLNKHSTNSFTKRYETAINPKWSSQKITKKLPVDQNNNQTKSHAQSVSFKNIGLGFNTNITTFGNSAHMSIQGNSPDIPQGEELRYITYLNQMANMIVSSMKANPQYKLIPHHAHERLVFHVKVDRKGNLLDTRMIQSSNLPIINSFILESVKNVGLFNPLPAFIIKDTFEINWIIIG